MAMNFVTFNQDYSHLAVGETSSAHRVMGFLNRTQCRHLERLPDIYHRTFPEMLRNQGRRHCHPRDALLDVAGSSHIITEEIADHKYQSMLLSLSSVGLKHCRQKGGVAGRFAIHVDRLMLISPFPAFQRHSTICELTFPTTVLAVRLNRKRLVVVLEDQIYLYDISNMKLLRTIETSPNPNGTTSDPLLLDLCRG